MADGFLDTPIPYPVDMEFGLPNCGLVALSIVSGTPLTEVTNWYRETYRMRGNWRGATNHLSYGRFFASRKLWAIHTSYARDRNRTIGDFAEWYAKPDTWYVVRSAGHAMVIRNGWIGDQNQRAPFNEHRKRNCRLKDSWEIWK